MMKLIRGTRIKHIESGTIYFIERIDVTIAPLNNKDADPSVWVVVDTFDGSRDRYSLDTLANAYRNGEIKEVPDEEF